MPDSPNPSNSLVERTGTRRSRKGVSEAQKQAVRAYWANSDPRPTQRDCVVWFQTKYNRSITRSTISRILSSKYAHLDTGPATASMRRSSSQWPILDQKLAEWLERYTASGKRANQALIQYKAAEYWGQIPEYQDLPKPAFSEGWVHRFKNRHSITFSRGAPTPDQNRISTRMGMMARCQCYKVQFVTPTDKPLALYACHCTECRHQSSAAFGITAVFPYFELPEPASEYIGSYTRNTLKGRHMECLFCKSCGSRLLHRFRDAMPRPGEKPNPFSTTNVKGGCLEGLDKEMMKGIVHIWTKHAIVEIPEGVEQWEEAPPVANPLER
ncbi:hypothetical protein N7490_005018 [Penicillium lividum]|nr:hypothetical protein N7490_005018 [Penicillium lividum]